MSLRPFLDLYRDKDRAFAGMPEVQFRILLDLAENGERDTTGLAMLCGAPQTTALRHLGDLHSVGLIERASDPMDRRKTIYRLTESGAERMAHFASRLAA